MLSHSGPRTEAVPEGEARGKEEVRGEQEARGEEARGEEEAEARGEERVPGEEQVRSDEEAREKAEARVAAPLPCKTPVGPRFATSLQRRPARRCRCNSGGAERAALSPPARTRPPTLQSPRPTPTHTAARKYSTNLTHTRAHTRGAFAFDSDTGKSKHISSLDVESDLDMVDGLGIASR